MNQIDRILKLWLYISDKTQFTAQELSEHFHVSSRTITRDLDYLTVIGVPFYSVKGKGGGYRMLKNPMLPPVFFSEDEVLSLFFALNMLKKLQDIPHDALLWELESKLKKQTTETIRQKAEALEKVMTYVIPPKNINNYFLKNCLEVALAKKEIKMTYNKATSEQEVICHPIGIYSMNGFWYMVAYIEAKEDYRIYRVDRILKIEELGISTINNLLSVEEWIATLKEQETIKVELIVEKEAYRTITNHWLINGETTSSDDNNLKLTAIIPVVQLFYVKQDLLKLGSKSTVLSPRKLVDDIKEELILSLKNYQ